MKKIEQTSYLNQLKKEGIELAYDEASDSICINGVKAKSKTIKSLKLYEKLENKGKTDKEIYRTLLELAKLNIIDLKQNARQAKHDSIQKLIDQGYEVSPDGKILDLVCNYSIALQNIGHKFSYNEFTHNTYIDDERVDAECLKELQMYMGRVIQHDKQNNISSAIHDVAVLNSFHPLRDFFTAGNWDGKERLAFIFSKFFGANDSALTREITKKWFVAAIKRLFEPGCKFDNMLILYDKLQGVGKSTFFERFCKVPVPDHIKDSYYLAFNKDANTKEIQLQLDDSWIVNFDELHTIIKNNADFVKSFLSQTEDKVRKPYDVTQTYYRRHCVFCGTTNNKTFLKDYTSDIERRYWIIECNGTWHSQEWWEEHLTDEYIKQVWYEAYYYYKQGKLNINDIDNKDELRRIQLKHKTFQEDVAMEYVKGILNTTYSFQVTTDSCEMDIVRDLRADDILRNCKVKSINSLTLSAVLKSRYNLSRNPQWCETVSEFLGFAVKNGNIYNPAFESNSQYDIFEEVGNENN